jgi:hypothetical protein
MRRLRWILPMWGLLGARVAAGCAERADELLPSEVLDAGTLDPVDAPAFTDGSGVASPEDSGDAGLGSADAADDAPPDASLPLLPMFECVVDNGDGTFTAYFNYANPNAFPLTVPIGTENHFSPSPDDQGQPTVFPPKPVDHSTPVFHVIAPNGTTLVWQLAGRSCSAGSTSKVCVPGYGESG